MLLNIFHLFHSSIFHHRYTIYSIIVTQKKASIKRLESNFGQDYILLVYTYRWVGGGGGEGGFPVVTADIFCVLDSNIEYFLKF